MNSSTVRSAESLHDTTWKLWTPPITLLATILAGLGSAFLYQYSFGRISESSPTWMFSAFKSTLAFFALTSPGYLFALGFLLTAKGRKRVPVWSGALFVIMSMAAYVIGRVAAMGPREFVRPLVTSVPEFLTGFSQNNLRGMLAGAIGATVLAIAFILVYRIWDWKRIAAIMFLVPATGLFIGIPFLDFDTPYLAFPLWQGCVGFVMAMLNPGAWLEEKKGSPSPDSTGTSATIDPLHSSSPNREQSPPLSPRVQTKAYHF